MEFKDKLKKMRMERGVSQQALADAIYVSRSAVAKWENGLGIPREETFVALKDYFGVSDEEFITEKPEEVIVEKNRSIRRFTVFLKCCGMVFLVLLSVLLLFSIMSGKYGLFPEMAAGEFKDNPCIKTKDYIIYYNTPILIVDGEKIETIEYFLPVKKILFGYYVFDEDYRYRELKSYPEGKVVGYIYSLKGRHGYYHILKKKLSSTEEMYLPLEMDEVTVDGETYPVQCNSFFVTEEPLHRFSVGDAKVFVGSNLIWRQPIK